MGNINKYIALAAFLTVGMMSAPSQLWAQAAATVPPGQVVSGGPPADEVTLLTGLKSIVSQLKQIGDNLQAAAAAKEGLSKYDLKEGAQRAQFVADQLDESRRYNTTSTDFMVRYEPGSTEETPYNYATMAGYNVASSEQVQNIPMVIGMGWWKTLQTNTRGASGTAEQGIKILTAAYQAGCMCKEDAEAFQSTGKISGGSTGGPRECSFINPQVLVSKKGGIHMSPDDPDTQCIMSHASLVAFGLGITDIRRGGPGGTPENFQKSMVQEVYKARAVNVFRSIVASLSNSFAYKTSDAKAQGQYETLTNIAQQKGVNCVSQGFTPSRNCLNRMVAAACNRSAELAAGERSTNGGSGLPARQAGYLNCMQTAKNQVSGLGKEYSTEMVEGALSTTQAYFESPEFKTYLASHDVSKLIKQFLAELPQDRQKIQREYAEYINTLDFEEFNPMLYAGDMEENKRIYAESLSGKIILDCIAFGA